MRTLEPLYVFLTFFVFVAGTVFAQNEPIRNDFSGVTAEENGVTIAKAGFGSIPLADVTFGDIPTYNTFDGATDGHGVIIQADPGEGVIIMPDVVMTENAALIRCSVRADGPQASVYLASIEQGGNAFVSTITPNNGAFFQYRYRRISDFFIPPSNGFQPVIQVFNTSETEPLTVFLDNLEILDLGSERINISMDEIVSGPGEDETITIDLPNMPPEAKPLEMVLIKAGKFMMGSSQEEIDGLGRNYANEGPLHQVTITKDFYMGKYEITQAQWQALMGSNPAEYWGVGSNHPVYAVSWYECQEFINKLNQLGQGTFRLPTEAEWEYVCRAGTTTRNYWGDSDDPYGMIFQNCWPRIYDKIASSYPDIPHDSMLDAQPVGLKPPNPWGLFDMIGNVSEWCQDWYSGYFATPMVDPKGPDSGQTKVIRGYCYGLSPESFIWPCRSATRGDSEPDRREGGVRISRILPGHNPTPTPASIATETSPPLPTPTSTPITGFVGGEENITINLPGLPFGVTPLDLVLIKAGTFMMGSSQDEVEGLFYYYNKADDFLDEVPSHQVTISEDFYIGKFEVTQAQWQAVMEKNPSFFKGNPNLPVETISWNDCLEFIAKLNQLGQGTFRLPTEAEWEYACRAGTSGLYFGGDDPSIEAYAWYRGRSLSHETHEVGFKLPNAWGLFDMSGNVFEWCQDSYDENYYSNSPETDPIYTNEGIPNNLKVLRGGSWDYYVQYCRPAYRHSYDASSRYYIDGIRVCRNPTGYYPSPTPTIAIGDETITVDLPGLPSVAKSLEMVRIKAGTFMMGSSQDEIDALVSQYENEKYRNEGPQHQVTLSKDFYIGKYEITQAQWQTVMGNNPSTYYNFGKPNFPVDNVSWNDCQVFVAKLERMGLGTFRLPTEAEWEYTCRAGTTERFFWGVDPDRIGDYAWYGGNKNDRPPGSSTSGAKEIGLKLPNPWGLFDMIGNLSEWCQDLYDENYYLRSPAIDPINTHANNAHVIRGGNWASVVNYCHSAVRSPQNINKTDGTGFRLARDS